MVRLWLFLTPISLSCLHPDVCSLAQDRGSCKNYTIMWFFDNSLGRCSRFWYGGCSGNENRFWTQKECENRCPTKTPGRRGDKEVITSQQNNYTIMWFFDNSLGRCSRFWYGGCGGNENRFWTQKECENRCPTKTPGRRGDDPGGCQNYTMMWFFDTEQNECSRFWYGGCGGNGNRFKTQQEKLANCWMLAKHGRRLSDSTVVQHLLQVSLRSSSDQVLCLMKQAGADVG
uniref:BPTI/Kunitz inhibitor domain-containing protein n=1 Tax=Lates calcarifer TaxID=8187 RepID=A0A4W6DQ90_LATCA